MCKPIIFLDFDGVVETIYWERDVDGSWSWNVHKSGREELNNKSIILKDTKDGTIYEVK